MKVCDRAYVTEDEEEESMSEHSYSPGIYSNTKTFVNSVLVLLLSFTQWPGVVVDEVVKIKCHI